ncbi:flagella biosynthesis chaperone FliJ [Grimontia hollisae]|uniref:Flagellar FliJ protein n=1 Tax=Grimontia hollisae CIP 101886 TaxID=675812 RepID=D0IC97_GRIHO|nr:flagellar export protein FliJ [Grimontia hollisae]AMG29890.1 flagella biosynthesis chaperone FliJ [Grimontia hollisae]EEY71515.1 flagellar protein FliJ [Grimontia hollisae CIP 101886]STO43120.1 flagellar biosynthesis chaperone [Grimontia hollisae]
MSDGAMILLIEQAKEQERHAHLALIAAQQELQSYYMQVAQIERYRLDYFRQLSERGQSGLSASSYGHLNRFIVQLDETLAKQRQVAVDFEDNVERCREHWQTCRQKTNSLEWLVEKRQKEASMRAERLEQKQMDEFATLIYPRQKSTF